jgi:hypothetical protein
MNRIYRKKNDADQEGELEMGVTAVNTMELEANAKEQDSGRLGEKVQQIRVLISRAAALSHYRAIDDIGFIIEAIGAKDYEGSPALDVLPSNEEIDSERREKVKEYIYCLNSWAEKKDIEDAVAEFKASEKLVRNTYIHLGELDEEKKQLALELAEALNGKVSSPEDVISEISDEEFVIHVYKNILDRRPDDDDLRIKLMELRRGKTRQELVKDVLESKESSRRMLAEIAQAIQKSSKS